MERPASERKTILVLLGGAAALIVAMGIGRFAFTPILPSMLDRQLFTAAGAGYLASSNYLGYLLGAVALTLVRVKNRSAVLAAGLLASIATTWGMAACGSLDGWLALRFLSGFASAVVFILVSGIVLERLSALQTGVFYGGVGTGILLTGLSVPLLSRQGDWSAAWQGLGAISLVLGAAAWPALRVRSGGAKPSVQAAIAAPPSDARRIVIVLMIAYGLEGLGYIVTGTYLAAFAKTVSSLPNLASVSWMVVGVAAAPSCLVWSLLASAWGKKRTLTAAMLLQAIGIALPVLAPSSVAVFVGAFLFGATFMGITTLFVAYAKELYPQNNRTMIGWLTAFFGLGQMIGPLVAGILLAGNGGYREALLGAASIVLLGALSLSLGIGRSSGRAALNRTV
ncbi:Predicted arabinose efflux permease, MFS family [Paenibacillus sp. UNC496MF]|uniref:YbfB/YjiJ family MFS transporter n=1 Tax=Paenibacillus sp. UNC496MF TaxID=1502753 RepID=UPI0008E7E06D|nr:YbfB/YjiJ family MFS transporter [Paenibacillus sp. UNC496MF]SFI89112.1 Predicted arabinose efflux permease, MFS family [Paenibacillus sp. UNC496MF]